MTGKLLRFPTIYPPQPEIWVGLDYLVPEVLESLRKLFPQDSPQKVVSISREGRKSPT